MGTEYFFAKSKTLIELARLLVLLSLKFCKEKGTMIEQLNEIYLLAF